MKKLILAVTLLAFVGMQTPKAKAHGFQVAAGGLVVGTAIGESLAGPVYAAPAPTYYPPVTYCQSVPATVVYAQPVYVPAPVVTVGFGFGPRYYRDDRFAHRHGYYTR